MAETGQAVEKCAAIKPDVVLLRVMSDRTDGFEAAEQMQSLFNIPIVFLTTSADHLVRERIRATGDYRYVSKPFRPIDLKCAIEVAINTHEVEQRLTENEFRYQALFENMNDAAAVYRAEQDGDDFILVDFNRAAEEIEQVSRSEVIGRNVLETFPGIKEFGLFEVFRRVWQTGKPEHHPIGEYKDDRIRGWRDNFVYKLPSGEIVAVYSNKTEHKKWEEKIIEKERRYRTLVETMNEGLASTDKNGVITFHNDRFAEMLGFNPNEAVGRFALEMVADEYVSMFKKKFHERSTSEIVSDYYELELKGKNGEKVPVIVSSRGNHDEDDQFQGVIVTFVDITDRKRAELALQTSERMCNDVLSAAPIGIAYSEEGKFKWANNSMLKMFGHKDEQDYLNTSTKAFYESESEYLRVRKAFYESLKDGKSVETEARFRRKDGSIFFGQIRINALDRENPNSATITTLADISPQKSAEEALRASEEKYRVLVERAQEGIFVTQDGLLRFVNPRMAEMLGLNPAELISMPFTAFVHADDRDLILDYHFKRLQGEELTSRYPFRILNRNEGIRWAEIDAALIQWEERPAVLGFLTDITERRAMEEDLKQSEEWHRSLVENSFDGIFVQQDSKIIFGNPRLYQMLGYSPGELEGMEHWRIYHGNYQKITRERGEARMRGENVPAQYEVMLERKDGSFFQGEVSAKVVNVKGRPAVQAWVKDISKKKRTEETQRRLATVVQQASEAVVIMDINNKIQYVNPAFEKITGYSPKDVIGQTPRMWQRENYDPVLYEQVWETVSGGQIWRGQLTNQRKDGTPYLEDVTVSPVRDSSGQIINHVAIKKDITREAELQKQLLQAQKMESLGTLAGGIAHDFNNLLTVIGGYSELLLLDKQEGDPSYEDLYKIIIATRRGAELVKNLLAFGSKVEPQLRRLDLNHEVEQIRKLLIRTIPKMIEIELSLAKNLARIKADPVQIGQVLINLALNAQDAMARGGKLTIQTRNESLDEEYCSAHPLVKPGAYVLLAISDTGHGMDEKTLEHIFEPFYTTKEVGKGTGLGLAVAYGIVQQHAGFIQCQSEPGRGTRFEIYLPAINDLPNILEEAPVKLEPIKGSETILLVDDEEFVRELGVRILSAAGYKMLGAANGREGLRIYEKSRDKIGLVILDLIMPEMGGKQCLEEILRIDPKAKVLIASGAGAMETTEDALAGGAKGFVRKPFKIEEMLGAIRRVLDSD